MSEKQYEKFIMNDFGTEKDDIGTLLYMLDDKKVSGLSFFTECA